MATYRNKTPHVLVLEGVQVEPLATVELDPDTCPILSKLIDGGYLVESDPPTVVVTEIHESTPEVPKKKPGRPKKAKS
jgi:hypothetical protein